MKPDENKPAPVAAPKRPAMQPETPFWVRLNTAGRNPSARSPSARTSRRAAAQRRR